MMICKRLTALLCVMACLLMGITTASADDRDDCLAMVQCFLAAEKLQLGMTLADFEAALTAAEIPCSPLAADGVTAYEFLPCLSLAVTGDPIEAAELRTSCDVHDVTVSLPLVLMREGGIEAYSAAMNATDHSSNSADIAECAAWVEEHGWQDCFRQPHPQDESIRRTLVDYFICCGMLKPGMPRQDVLALLDAWTAENGGVYTHVGYAQVHPDERALYRLNSVPMHSLADLALGYFFENGRLVCLQIVGHLYEENNMLGGQVTVCTDVDWDALP